MAISSDAGEVVEYSATDARENISRILGRAEHAHGVTAITRNGRRVAAVVPAEYLDLLDELEDRALSRMGAEALAEHERDGGETISHKDLMAELNQH